MLLSVAQETTDRLTHHTLLTATARLLGATRSSPRPRPRRRPRRPRAALKLQQVSVPAQPNNTAQPREEAVTLTRFHLQRRDDTARRPTAASGAIPARQAALPTSTNLACAGVCTRRMKTAVGILALAVWWVLFVGPGDVSAQGAARVAARVAPRVASARSRPLLL